MRDGNVRRVRLGHGVDDTSTKRQDGIIEYIQFQAFEKDSREGQILRGPLATKASNPTYNNGIDLLNT